jgi:hypothetical protein
MAVKTITANLNVVPVGIENTKAKFQELLKSANISPAIRLDIDKILSKIDEIAPRIQGQLSGKGALNIDRMGFGKLDELIFKVAKNISKELGVAFDTTKVDEYANKIKDVNNLINANEMNESYKFSMKTSLNKSFRNGFWYLTSLRFFYIYEFMKRYNVSNVIHLENDVPIYYNCDELSSIVDPNFMYIPFDTYRRNIASIMYIPSHEVFKAILDNYNFSKNLKSL